MHLPPGFFGSSGGGSGRAPSKIGLGRVPVEVLDDIETTLSIPLSLSVGNPIRNSKVFGYRFDSTYACNLIFPRLKRNEHLPAEDALWGSIGKVQASKTRLVTAPELQALRIPGSAPSVRRSVYLREFPIPDGTE